MNKKYDDNALGWAILTLAAIFATGAGLLSSYWIGTNPGIGLGLLTFPVAFIVIARLI